MKASLSVYTPGLLFVVGITLIAYGLGYVFPMIGGPVFGIIIGIIINNIFGKPSNTLKGIMFSAKKPLQWAIIFLGCGISLSQVWATGLESLFVMLTTLAAAFLTAYIAGKLMGVPFGLKSLIGVGTAICGGSAIAAVSPIIEAKDEEIAYSISTIFLFNVAAVLLFPPLGHWIGLSNEMFGLWAGTAINDTSSVVAAGYAYSDEAGTYATIVKLTRTTMIIPISILFAIAILVKKKREANLNPNVTFRFRKIFPWFIVWFAAASLLNSLGLFNELSVHYLEQIGKFFIVMALTAVGLSADFRKMLQTGMKPMLLGLLVWAAVVITSIALIFI